MLNHSVKSMRRNFIFFILFLFLTCRVPSRNMYGNDQPIIRVGIIEERESVQFEVENAVTFLKPDGRVATRNAQPGQWKVELVNAKPAEFVYRLAVGTSRDYEEANAISLFIQKKGLATEIVKNSLKRNLKLPYLHRAAYQVFLSGEFKSEKDAKIYRTKIADKTNSEIVKIPKGKPEGRLKFTQLDSKYYFESAEPLHITASRIEIADVDIGSGFHWEKSVRRIYDNTIEFILDTDGKITVVNELPLETYLKGVVPAEMPAGFPIEALKAQAVAARVEAVSKIGLRHPVAPYDLCDDVHCQAFSGVTKTAKSTEDAVDQTHGVFMVYHDQIAEAFYSGLCGGHTEHNENVWVMNSKPFLRGVLDGSGRDKNRLNHENGVKDWIDTYPDVYCNSLNDDVPESVNYGRKYFRWQVEYSREELEKIISDKTGESFGQLRDLKPLTRGASGRIIELEIIGTAKRFVLSKELTIRQALSNKTLYSACFYVTKVGSHAGLPDKFILKGAGWGHGVGMCQVGAAVMAHRGKRFNEILLHYYESVKIKKLY